MSLMQEVCFWIVISEAGVLQKDLSWFQFLTVFLSTAFNIPYCNLLESFDAIVL